AARINLGSVAMSLGAWEEAERHLEAARDLSEALGDAYGALAAAGNLGRLALETGRACEAHEQLARVWQRARELELANLTLDAQIALAEAKLALGEREK